LKRALLSDAPAIAPAQNGQAARAYVTQSSHGKASAGSLMTPCVTALARWQAAKARHGDSHPGAAA
jgi:hypothetical protein